MPAKSKKIKAVLHLFAGNAVAQVVLVVFGLFLPRLYGPELFGDFSLFLSALNVLTVFAGMRYDQVVVMPGNEQESRELVQWGSLLALLFLMFGLTGWSVAMLGFPGLRNSWFGYSLVGAAFSGSILLFQQYLVVTGRFVKLGWSRFTFAFGTIAAQTGLYWILPEKGLLLGYLAGLLANLMFLGREIRASFYRFSAWEPAQQAGKRYWPVVRYSLISGVVSLLISNFQPFLIAWAFDIQRAGFYFLAYRILGVPFNLIAGSISPVFIRETVHNLQKSPSTAYAAAVRMVAVLLGVFVLLSILAVWFLPAVLDFAWGSKWNAVSAFTLWLIPLSIANGCIAAMSNLPEVLKKTRVDLIFGIALALFAVFSVLLGRFFEDFMLFLTVFSFGTALLKGGIIIYYLGVLKTYS